VVDPMHQVLRINHADAMRHVAARDSRHPSPGS
jgi:hypothetical protein